MSIWNEKPISITSVAILLISVVAAFSLFAVPNAQAILPPSPTPTPPAFGPPNITTFAPLPPVNNTVGTWRTFNVTVNQTVNVSWYLNGSPSPLHTNDTVQAARYTLRAVTVGKHYVNASAVNENGSDNQTWIWNVTNPPCCDCGDICVNENGWWRCGGAFNINDTPIQAAVDNATEGETICVKDGTYNENVDVDKRLTVRSENGSANCIVNASNYNDHVFEVTADYVNISGFTVTGATRNSTNALYMKAGVCLGDTEHGDLSDINATNNFNGIQLRNSSNNTLVNNTANSNEYSGIFLFFSNDTTITGNTANSNHHVGIFLCEFNNNNTVTGNNVSNNGEYGICLYSSSNNNVVDGNNASNNGDHGIYLSTSSNNNNITNNTANSNSDYGIYLRVSCNYNTLTNNTASNNGHGVGTTESEENGFTDTIVGSEYGSGIGICLDGSDNNTLTDNTASDNFWCGIALGGSDDNILTNNTALDNGDYIYRSESEDTILTDTIVGSEYGSGIGICLAESNNNTLTENNASDNFWCGIFLGGSYDNTLTDNIASNNGNMYPPASEDDFLSSTIVGQYLNIFGSGIYLAGSNSNNLTDNTVSGNMVGIFLDSSSDNTLLDNTASDNEIGILVGQSEYWYNCASDNDGNKLEGGYFGGSMNNDLIGNTASGNMVGIFLLGFGEGVDSFASDNGGNELGLYFSGAHNNTLIDNTVYGNLDGIGLLCSDNNNLTGNVASGNIRGIDLTESDNNDLKDNTASNNEVGIYLIGGGLTSLSCFGADTELGYDPFDGSNNNALMNNTASSNTEYDFYSDEYAHDNTVDELLICSYPTTISFTYGNGAGIKGVAAPQPNPAGKENIGKYVNVTNVTETSWVSLKVHYSDADLTDVTESSLRLYHWNETMWEEVPGSAVVTAEKYVFGNVTSFCQVAPFGDPKPKPRPPHGGGDKDIKDEDGDGFLNWIERMEGTNWTDPCDPDPYCAACLHPPTPSPSPTPTPTPTAPPRMTPVPPPKEVPTPPPTLEEPGFNVLYAILAFLGILGLLGGAYYILVLKP